MRASKAPGLYLFLISLTLLLVSCPLPFEFRPLSSAAGGGSNDPANPLITSIPDFEFRSLTTGDVVTSLNQDVVVKLLTETKGAAIYYTIVDGAATPPVPEPGQTGTYLFDPAAPPELAGHLCCKSIRAIAIGPNMYPSLECSATFTIEYPMAVAPTFSPEPGVYTTDQSIAISTETEGAQIYYTSMVDGAPADPTPGDPAQLYTGPIDVAGPATAITFKAVAVADQLQNSPVATETFTIEYPTAAAPTFSPPPGSYAVDLSIELSSETDGALIYYTSQIGGVPADPTIGDPGQLYSGPIEVTGPETTITIKAIAAADQMLDSPVVEGTWAVGYVCEPPTFSFEDFAILMAPYDRVQISCATPDAQIAYWVDGPPQPNAADPVGPVTMPSLVSPSDYDAWTWTDYTISAIAHKPGWIDSTVASITITMDYLTSYWDWDGQSIRDTIEMYQEFGLWYGQWFSGIKDYDPLMFLYETDEGNFGKMRIDPYPYYPGEIEFDFETWDPSGGLVAGGWGICHEGAGFDLDTGTEFGAGEDFFLLYSDGIWIDLDGYGANWFSCIGWALY
jgi:chitobiase/beta-hexosaminidase-like protein